MPPLLPKRQTSTWNQTFHERCIMEGFRFPDYILAKYHADFFFANEADDKEARVKEWLAPTLD